MAKKKSPAELKEEGVALGEKINAARKKPYKFALSIGKEGLVLETHLNKSPDVLWRTAKKNGGGPKGAMGTMSVKGKIIELTCEDDSAPGTLPKLAKKFFTERGQAYKVVLITPSGEVGDEDDADTGKSNKDAAREKPARAKPEPRARTESRSDPAQEAPKRQSDRASDAPPKQAEEQAAEKAPKRKPALAKAFGTLKPEVLGLMKIANPEQRGQLQTLMKTFGSDLNKGEFDLSEATLDQLRNSIGEIKTRRAEGSQKRKAELVQMRSKTDAIIARLKTMRENRQAV